jgi:iron complex transport system substrate-binding protein
MTGLRIVSLIPSATEIVVSLGLGDSLVGRSHECDYPEFVKTLPVCTQPKFNPEGTSPEIHDRVTALLQSALSVYRVETGVLETLQPTHIVTQAQCEVCAVSLADVEQAAAQLTQSHPQILSLQPNILADVWADIERVAVALGVEEQGAIAPLKQRIESCRQITAILSAAKRPTVACIEWPDPLMAAGNWIPELVELAGGRLPDEKHFGSMGKHSPWLEWSALTEADPDILVFLPCGYDLERTHQEVLPLTQQPEWRSLKAVQTHQVYLTDGNQYFNRPGPRLVDSLEILAEIFHPDRFQFGYEGKGWRKFTQD